MNLLERQIDTIDPRLSVSLRRLKLRFQHDRLCDVVRRMVEPGHSVVDIGANRGVYTWMMSRQVGQGGRVHAVEPYPGNIARLAVLARSRPNITVHPVALSDSDGAATLHVPRHQHLDIDALASLRTTVDDHFVPMQVGKRRLDSLLAPDEAPIRFIKCDVEGHEDEVVDGAWRTITRDRPIMAIEIEQRHRSRPATDLIQRIVNEGYDCYFLDEDGSHPVAEFDIARHQLDYLTTEFIPHAMPRGYVNNFLFFPTSGVWA
ncbi:FkbM family methyltransferase [Mycolicibacterium cosmeticum]|uniref:FkbM family methyltransferase n=1 Tax=Mycolicibacterium cosmeticum TaxID=258533 RepID=UPI0004262A11